MVLCDKDYSQKLAKAFTEEIIMLFGEELKRIYGMLENQFHNTFVQAEKLGGKTGDNLITLLESRLDNIVFRMRFASSRSQARQFVSHGHVLVNGRRVTIPSYRIRENDSVEIAESSKKMLFIKEALKEFTRSGVSPWLEVDPDAMSGTIRAIPRRSDVTDIADVKEQLVVELYSR